MLDDCKSIWNYLYFQKAYNLRFYFWLARMPVFFLVGENVFNDQTIFKVKYTQSVKTKSSNY